jgi:U3 small nucleolar RNA-associated protein 3
MSIAAVERNTKSLSKKERLKLMKLDAPELVAVAGDVRQKLIVKELLDVLGPLRTFLQDKKTQKYFGNSTADSQTQARDAAFLEYLHVKEQYASSYLVNLLFLMSLHVQKILSRSHPVMKQLLELQYVARSLEKLDVEFENDLVVLLEVLKAYQSSNDKSSKAQSKNQPSLAELFANARAEISNSTHISEIDETVNESTDDDNDDDDSEGSQDDVDDDGEESNSDDDYEAYIRDEEMAMNTTDTKTRRKKNRNDDSSEDSDSNDDDVGDAGEYQNAHETDANVNEREDRKKRQKQALISSLDAFGNVFTKDVRNKRKVGIDDALPTAGPKLDKRQKKRALQADEADESAQGIGEDYYDDQGGDQLAAMEKFLEMVDPDSSETKRTRRAVPTEEDVDDELYEKFANKKKAYLKEKEDHYKPEARYGSMFDVDSSDIIKGTSELKRAATYEMIKNKGLTPHRKKENRNPRVKKRLAYDRALVRRRGQVREVNTSGVNTGSEYAGEATGIKANLSRARKIST